MRLVAVYIESHFLFVGSEIINFGGKYFYYVELNEEGKYVLHRKENHNFIENFWGKDISLVSAIVGGNGTGKTNVFRNINKSFSPYDKQEIVDNNIYIFENLADDELYYSSESAEVFNATKIKKNLIETIYFSPVIEYDLSDINSPISMINYHKESLFLFYLQNIQRHLFLLQNLYLIEDLTNSYKNFPIYDKLTFKANQLYKDDFEKVYIQSTLGNNFFKVRNDLMHLTKNKPYCFEDEKAVEEFFNNKKSINDELKEIWNLYKNNDESSNHLLHNGKNFIKDLEVNLLSYLVINDIFEINGDNGNYDFNKIKEADDFIVKLNHYLNKYIIQTSKFFYKILSETEISILNTDILLSELQDNVTLNTGKINGFEISRVNKSVENHLFLFKNIHEFYIQILEISKSEYAVEIEGGFEVDIKGMFIEDFNRLIKTYENLQNHLSGMIPVRSENILEIKSSKKLSTGEKALLDLYSSIYDYLYRFGEHQYAENCIFLLDEADLGFHPEWKIKFVNALNKTLPILVKAKKNNIKNLQIIFATHDPLTLSDIPSGNVVYLEKFGNRTSVLSQQYQSKKSFGANITDLLADSFFINDGLIGDFAKDKIEEVINFLNDKDNSIRDKSKAKQIIDIIDEPILRIKLVDMYFEKFPEEYNKEKEIEEIMKKANKLGLNIKR